jgi:FkbM family methyltransferase
MKKDFKYDTWEMFNKNAENKKIVIFGGGMAAKNLIGYTQRVNSKWNIIYIVDNDEKKWGTDILTYIIKEPIEMLKMQPDEYVVLICGQHVGEIAEQLENMGIQNYYSEFWMNQIIKVSYKQIVPNEKIAWLNQNLTDDESRRVLAAIVEKRKYNFMDYTDIKTFGGSEYFIDDFWKPISGNQEVFIDGGGFDGDSIEEFIEWTKGDYRKIYSFEPDPRRTEQIQDKLWKWNGKVELHKKGLYDCETILKFTEGNELYSGKIDFEKKGEQNIEINTVALDTIVKEKVTFIKMDIEGAEIQALNGAKSIILRDKPRLAICIYHRLEDLWQIPELIKSMVPEYKMYIRHFGVRCRGTILYAHV